MKILTKISGLKTPWQCLAGAWLICAALMMSAPVLAAERLDSLGKEFWLGFTKNYSSTPELSLFISGRTATSGTVEIPALGFSQAFDVTPGAVTTVTLPDASVQAYEEVQNKGIHIVADDEIAVYGLNRIPATTDAYLALPVDVLGTEYRALGYVNDIGFPSQYLVVATENGTTVTAPAVGDCPAVDVTLDAGHVYQVGCTDVSGTLITASAPIAVFAGNECTNIPPGFGACDHVVEQMPPVSSWGRQFVTEPLATRQGDTFRILAHEDGTEVSINGTSVATLAAGQFHETILNEASVIETSGPALVAQYSNGTGFDGVTSDPFEMLVTPYEQFLTNYTVTTPASGFSLNFINVVVPDAAVGQLMLDGAVVPASQFSPIGGSGFSGAQLAVDLGAHTLDASVPFGVFVYGFADADSYGYPGGGTLAPIAIATNLGLTPVSADKVIGEQHCVIANVTDQHNNPLESIRVDFSVTGVNVQDGVVFTDTAGAAEYCYAGQAVGQDTILAAVGQLNATAQVTWSKVLLKTALDVIQAFTIKQDRKGQKLLLVLRAKLAEKESGNPIGGKKIVFRTKYGSVKGGNPVNLCTAVTTANGLAQCQIMWPSVKLAVYQTPGKGVEIVGAFAGDDRYEASEDTRKRLK